MRFEYDNHRYRTPMDFINKLIRLGRSGQEYDVEVEDSLDSLPFGGSRHQVVVPITFTEEHFYNQHELIHYFNNDLSSELGCEVMILVV